MIPEVLKNVADKISNSSVELSKRSQDGRVNSIESEKIISKFIKDHSQYMVEIPADRSWYDIKIEKFYCNIKVSEMSGNDNTIGKAAIYYFLTGRKEAPNQYKEFFKSMCKNEDRDKERDFYFIVVRKTDKKAFIISLKRLEVKTAPNNPPFQCNWSQNIEQKPRSGDEAKKYLLSSWAKSLKKRAEQQINIMKKHYPDYFK